MSLLVTADGESKIKISGTDIEINSVYIRLGAVFLSDGLSLDVLQTFHENKSKYQLGKNIRVEFSLLPGVVIGESRDICSIGRINLEDGENQSLQTLHDKMQALYESLGYTVEQKDGPF